MAQRNLKQILLLDYSRSPAHTKKKMVTTGTVILKKLESRKGSEDPSDLAEKPTQLFTPLKTSNTKLGSLQDGSSVSSLTDFEEKNTVSSLTGGSIQSTDLTVNERIVEEIGYTSVSLQAHHGEIAIRRKRRHMLIPKSQRQLVKRKKSKADTIGVLNVEIKDGKKWLEPSIKQDKHSAHQSDTKPKEYPLNMTISTGESGRRVSVLPSKDCALHSPSRKRSPQLKCLHDRDLMSEDSAQSIDSTLQKATTTQECQISTSLKSYEDTLQTATASRTNKLEEKIRNQRTTKSINNKNACCSSSEILKNAREDGEVSTSAGTSDDRTKEVSECIQEESEDDHVVMVSSTPQEKEARRLARQRQLRNLRTWEETESRRERAMRRRKRTGRTEEKSGQGDRACKRIKWREEETLVSVYEYSPPKDDLEEGIQSP